MLDSAVMAPYESNETAPHLIGLLKAKNNYIKILQLNLDMYLHYSPDNTPLDVGAHHLYKFKFLYHNDALCYIR